MVVGGLIKLNFGQLFIRLRISGCKEAKSQILKCARKLRSVATYFERYEFSFIAKYKKHENNIYIKPF